MDRSQQVMMLKLEHVDTKNRVQFGHLLARIQHLEDTQQVSIC